MIHLSNSPPLSGAAGRLFGQGNSASARSVYSDLFCFYK